GTFWNSLGSGVNGVEADVYAVGFLGTNLYVGGDFTMAGSTSANGIARWNGTTWNALGSGVGGAQVSSVYTLAMLGTDVYVAGLFTTAGGMGTGDTAKWNGSTWSGLGSSVKVSTNYYPSVYA